MQSFDLSLTDEQQIYYDQLSTFSREQLSTKYRKFEDQGFVDKQVISQIQELGLDSLSVPVSLGGAGLERDLHASYLMGYALATGGGEIGSASVTADVLGNMSAIHFLLDFGSEQQQSDYIPKLLAADENSCSLAVAENRDAQQFTCEKQGNDWVLNGTKALVFRAKSANMFIVVSEKDNMAWIVDASQSKVSLNARSYMGLEAAGPMEVCFDNLKVNGDCQIQMGESEVAKFKVSSIIGNCALLLGAARSALHYVVPYVNSREAFGEPISHRQSIAFMVADMATELDAMELMCQKAAVEDIEKRSLLASQCYRLACKYLPFLGSSSVQLLGGHGYTMEHPVEMWYRELNCISTNCVLLYA